MTKRFSGADPVPGLVLSIPLGDGTQAYGRVVSGHMEFFDRRDPEGTTPDVEDVIRSDRAFRHWVSDAAIRSRRWTAVGVVTPTEAEAKENFPVWRLDVITGHAYLYEWDPVAQKLGGKRLTRAQCEEMEMASTMSDTNAETRLRNFFAGLPDRDDEMSLAQVVDP